MDKESFIRLATAVLLLLQMTLQSFGIDLGPELVEAILNVLTAGWVVWAIWKNNYLGKKGEKQKKALEANGLK